MTIFYAFFLSVFIAIGASCSGDVARLQGQIDSGINLFFYEPTSALAIKFLSIFFLNQSAALLHLIAIFILINSFRYYFLSTGLISRLNFYFISFIFIFNPLSFQLVTQNTRQLFFTALVSVPFNYLVASYINKNFKNVFDYRREKILKIKISPIIFTFLAIGAHSTFPIVIIFFVLLIFTYKFLKILITFNPIISIPSSFKAKYLFYFLIISPILFFLLYTVFPRLVYVLRLYGPFIKTIRAESGSMIFDYGSPSLLISSFITLSLFIYLAFKIPKNFLLAKSFFATCFLSITLPFIFAVIFPLFINFFARSYIPIALLTLPIALVTISSVFSTKFYQFIFFIFFISSLSLQTQKYLNSQSSRDTFFSINNIRRGSCSLTKNFERI